MTRLISRQTTELCLMTLLYIVFALLMTFFIHDYLLLSGDIGYLLEMTKVLWNGGHYPYDIFETNPPMILYWYLPVYLIAHTFSLPLEPIFQCYLFLLASISFFTCYYLIDKIVPKCDTLMRYGLLNIIAISYLLLPLSHFGQREHILLITMLPYLFAAVIALNNQSLPPFLRLLIGIAAGLGFALKPFFIITPILIELYFIAKKRSLFGWIRIESVTILVVLITYLTSVFITQPDYINIMLPLLLRYYFPGTAGDWRDLMQVPITLFFVTIPLFSYFMRPYQTYRVLYDVILLATISAVIIFLIPRNLWHLHVFPACALLVLLLLMIIMSIAKIILRYSSFTTLVNVFLIAIIGTALCYWPIQYILWNYHTALSEKNVRPAVIQYAKSHLQHLKTVACISLNVTNDCFPLAIQSHLRYQSRFPFYWWIRGQYLFEEQPQRKFFSDQQFQQDMHFLYTEANRDLSTRKPDLIIYNKAYPKWAIHDNFNLITYLERNPEFRLEWQHYRFLKTIAHFDLYVRKTEKNETRSI